MDTKPIMLWLDKGKKKCSFDYGVLFFGLNITYVFANINFIGACSVSNCGNSHMCFEYPL